MPEESRSQTVSLTKAELQYLDALIAMEEEQRSGSRDEIVVFESPEPFLFWAGIGKFLWKHKAKIVGIATAATDLIGLDAKSRARLKGS